MNITRHVYVSNKDIDAVKVHKNLYTRSYYPKIKVVCAYFQHFNRVAIFFSDYTNIKPLRKKIGDPWFLRCA